MARFEATGIDSMLSALDKWEASRIAPIMLEEAVPILEKNVKKHTALHKDTGEMQSSIKKTKAKRTGKDGYSICVRPTGTDEKDVRNMEKVAYLEYGTSRQKASPVLSPAVKESEEAICDKMQEVFEREIGVGSLW